uniref:5-formyltetrahydrofolate cyclo-ligase-like n=1 Tax=Rhizophora mucronata TaxID=61149 RepID=A0A2P2JRI9_RHIMU
MMSTIDLRPNAAVRVMFRRCKPIAGRLINKANHASPFAAHPCTIASSTASPPPFCQTIIKDSVGSRNLEATYQAKRSLRWKIRKELKNMDPIQRSHEDNAIQSLVLEAPWFKASRSLCVYISCASLREVDTSRIISEVLSNPPKEGNAQSRKKLYAPRVEDKNSNMRILKITSVDDLMANSMNILEPTLVDSDGNQREDAMQASEPVDLFILPGLAFDRSGRRLGRSGGWVNSSSLWTYYSFYQWPLFPIILWFKHCSSFMITFVILHKNFHVLFC